MKTIRRLIIFLLMGALIMPAGVSAAYLFTNDAMEQQQGDAYAAQLEAETGTVTYRGETFTLQQLGNELLKSASNRRWNNYTFKILNQKEANAYAVPGGHVYITSGLYEMLGWHEKAFIIAHEIGHVEMAHWRETIEKQAQTAFAAALLIRLITGSDEETKEIFEWVGPIIAIAVSRGYGFDKEHEADRKAFDYAVKAGYSPGGGAVAFQLMSNKFGGDDPPSDLSSDIINFINPHPKFSTRISRQLQYLMEYSGGRVTVRDSAVYLDNRFVIDCKPFQHYTAKERAYYMAGELARLAHDGLLTIEQKFSANDDGFYINDKLIFYMVKDEESGRTIAQRIVNIVHGVQ